ncbi:putative MFS monocarboxylate transporter [Rhizodiscina lignyota]|uniref:MFS monocarboxylate transporter n=1 Tax=Rhizodiscina lignyota TaxID=1504668 RepID=A0A9P4IQC9_9PEZI|nr:putative MFS monocarboxylate transporter [Rhizodiscina lignyota]
MLPAQDVQPASVSVAEKEPQHPDDNDEKNIVDSPTVESQKPEGTTDLSEFPEGGTKAWIVLFGCFCISYSTFGWPFAIGVFQNYYERNQLRGESRTSISVIQGLEPFFLFFLGLPVGALYSRFGPRPLIWIGTFLHVFGIMMASLSRKEYQLVLSQGIWSPIGLAMCYHAAVQTLATWFLEKRALATGLFMIGSSIAGMINPIVVSNVLRESGFPWAMRSAGFLVLFMLLIGCVTVRSRIPPNPVRVTGADLAKPFKDPVWVVLAFAIAVFMLVFWIPYNYLVVEATSDGVSERLAGYLLTILNAAGLPFRLVFGKLADRFGRFNVTIFCNILCGIMSLALWIPANSNTPLIVFAVFYGIFSSGWLVNAPVCVMQITPDIRELPIRLGMMFLVGSTTIIVSLPIAGQIISDNNGSYWGLKVYTGVISLLAAAIMIAARTLHVGWKIFVKV